MAILSFLGVLLLYLGSFTTMYPHQNAFSDQKNGGQFFIEKIPNRGVRGGLAKDHTFSGFFSFGTLPYLELKTTFLFIGLCLPTVNTSPTPSYFVHKDCSSKTICKFHIDINNSGIITYVSVPIFYSCTEAMHYAAIPM